MLGADKELVNLMFSHIKPSGLTNNYENRIQTFKIGSSRPEQDQPTFPPPGETLSTFPESLP